MSDIYPANSPEINDELRWRRGKTTSGDCMQPSVIAGAVLAARASCHVSCRQLLHVIAIAIAVALATGWPAQAGDKAAGVGRIEQSSGPARIERNGHETGVAPAVATTQLFRGDRLATGPSGRLAIRFRDGSRLMLGAMTSVTVVDFMSDAHAAGSALLLELGRGILRLTAAPRDRLQHHRAEVRTTAGTVQTGGTLDIGGGDLVARHTSGTLSVLLLAGRLEVRNMAGAVVLDRARHGIEKVEADREPGSAYGWHRHRIEQTLTELELP